MKEILKNIGLTEQEIMLYLGALQAGTNTVSMIARHVSSKRQTILYTMKKLVNKGYLSKSTKHGTTYYTAIHPDDLIKLQEEHVRKLASARDELMSMANILSQKPKVLCYEGEGIEKILDDMINHESGVIRVVTNYTLGLKHYEKELRQFRNKRSHNHHVHHILSPSNAEVHKFLLETTSRLSHDEYRELKENIFHIENDIVILERKICTINLLGVQKFGFIIESDSLAHSLSCIFDTLWKTSKKIL